MKRFLKIVFYGIALNYVGFLLIHKIYWSQVVKKENVGIVDVKHLYNDAKENYDGDDHNASNYHNHYYAESSKTTEKDSWKENLNSDIRSKDDNDTKRENELEEKHHQGKSNTDQQEQQDTNFNVMKNAHRYEDTRQEKSNNLRDNDLGLNTTDEKNATVNTKLLYIYRNGYARLGNLVFWYTSTYGIATYYGRKAIWGKGMADMLKLFPYLSMEFMEEPKGWKPIHTKLVDYDPKVMQGIPQENLTLGWYTHSYLYFNHCNADLYHQMRIKEEYLQHARAFINKTKDQFLIQRPKSGLHAHDVMVVGVHVRRGDKLQAFHQSLEFGHRLPDMSEIHYAMEYLRYKHKHRVIFIIGSDDKKWCRETLTSEDSFVIPFSSQYDDFASLALSDHLIMTQGTFGWWAAWFVEQRAKLASTSSTTEATTTTKGNTDILFYKNPYWENSKLWKIYVREHVYPQHWKAYTNHSIDTQHQVLCNSTDVRLCFGQ